MILFTVGTHEQPFDRLVSAAQRVAKQLDERIVVQAGPSQVMTPDCERHDHVSPAQLAEWMRQARVVVLHGGPSTLREVLDAGALPVVVPRDPARGEHVDAHQLHYASSLSGGIVCMPDTEELVAWLVAGDLPSPPDLRRSDARTLAYCTALDIVLQDIYCPRVSATVRFRAILRAISRRFPNGS